MRNRHSLRSLMVTMVFFIMLLSSLVTGSSLYRAAGVWNHSLSVHHADDAAAVPADGQQRVGHAHVDGDFCAVSAPD